MNKSLFTTKSKHLGNIFFFLQNSNKIILIKKCSTKANFNPFISNPETLYLIQIFLLLHLYFFFVLESCSTGKKKKEKLLNKISRSNTHRLVQWNRKWKLTNYDFQLLLPFFRLMMTILKSENGTQNESLKRDCQTSNIALSLSLSFSHTYKHL